MTQKQQKLGEWNQLKYHLDSRRDRLPLVKEQEVWWCALGENIGVEINGKGTRFTRPAVMLKKLGSESFLIVPLTSKYKKGSWYVPFRFLGKTEVAVLSQIRVISTRRIYRQLGTIDDSDFLTIKTAFHELYR
ncbi:type II toxin-antitoxin system PemK/MazF family toxin [bacterium]|nr:type II toxin-antitoxin system PemK/MazF family toxin [bacterium]